MSKYKKKGTHSLKKRKKSSKTSKRPSKSVSKSKHKSKKKKTKSKKTKYQRGDLGRAIFNLFDKVGVDKATFEQALKIAKFT